MLSDDLMIVRSNLEKSLIMYTRKVINPHYNKEVEEEIRDIMKRLDALSKKLKDEKFTRSYRYD